MSKEDKVRLKEMCIKVWSLLTDDEKEQYYYNDGTIGFVEDMSNILYIDSNKLTVTDLDDIIDSFDWEE